MELLSIIIPLYNAETTITIGVHSIINQTFTSWRLILVNDGSTDSSGKICDALAMEDNRIEVIHQNNGGASAARNEGLRHANGKYITFMDADDVLTSSVLYETIINILENDDSLDVVQFDTIFNMGAKDEHKRKYPFKKYTKREEIYAAYLSEHIHVAVWDKVFRKKVFDGVFFPVGQTAEDIAVIPQIIENMKSLQTVSYGYYGYIYLPSSTSHCVKSFEHIVSILKSYFIYCNSALKYASIRVLANEVYTGQLWMYFSVIRTNYPSRIKEFFNSISLIKLPVREILKAKVSKKRKWQMLAISLFGKTGILFLQRIFTRNHRK